MILLLRTLVGGPQVAKRLIAFAPYSFSVVYFDPFILLAWCWLQEAYTQCGPHLVRQAIDQDHLVDVVSLCVFVKLPFQKLSKFNIA